MQLRFAIFTITEPACFRPCERAIQSRWHVHPVHQRGFRMCVSMQGSSFNYASFGVILNIANRGDGLRVQTHRRDGNKQTETFRHGETCSLSVSRTTASLTSSHTARQLTRIHHLRQNMQLACIAKLRVSRARLGGVRAEHAGWHGTAPMSCPRETMAPLSLPRKKWRNGLGRNGLVQGRQQGDLCLYPNPQP